MAVCKECGALNPDNNKFCSECGQPIVKLDSKAIRDAMSQMEAEFEQDALVNLDRSRLTYICDVCGKVNPIDAKQCLRCGKKRPRSDYINALTKIKNSKNLKRAVESMSVSEEKPAAVSNVQNPQQELPTPPPAPVLSREEQSSGEEAKELSLYRLTPQSQTVEQNRQIVQPFVIVPYVSQNQPLLQYDPNEVYRYMPYTNEEKKLEAERQAKLAESAEQRKLAQEAELRSRKKESVETMLAKKKAQEKSMKKARRPRSAKVSVLSLVALIVAVAGLFAAFADIAIEDFNLFRFVKNENILQVCPNQLSMSFDGTYEILMSVFGILVLLWFVAVALCGLQCFVRIFTGRIRKRGFLNALLPLLSLIFAIGIAVIYLVTQLVFEAVEFSALFADGAVFGWIVAVAVAVLLLIFYCAMGARKRRVRRK